MKRIQFDRIRPDRAAVRLCAIITLFLTSGITGTASAVSIGPGDVPVNGNNFNQPNSIYIDVENTLTLPAGMYSADTFHYQFSTSTGDTLAGTVTPILVTSPVPGSYIMIAVGAPVSYTGVTAFISQAFGGSNTFTLPDTDIVYAAFHHDSTAAGTSNPIGIRSGIGSTEQFINGSLPMAGDDVDGSLVGSFGREYDFSIDINFIPEPSSIVLFGTRLNIFYQITRRKNRSIKSNC